MKTLSFKFALPALLFTASAACSSSNTAVNETKNTSAVAPTNIAVNSTAPGKINPPPAGNQMSVNTNQGGAGAAPTLNAANQTAVSSEKVEETIPDVELQSLVKSTLLDFDSAIHSESFESFHSSASKPFQRQYTPEYLQQAFGKLIQKKTDFSKIAALQADLTSWFETQNGLRVLAVSGSYQTKPITLFDIKYIEEDMEWKVFYINVGQK